MTRSTLVRLLLASLAPVACNPADDGDDTDTDADTDVGETDSDADTDAGVDPDLVVATVLDRDSGAPDPNEVVIFFGPDGAVVAEVETNADGRASTPLPDGGSVVCMLIDRDDEDAFPNDVVAYLDVQPGDRLTCGFTPQTTGAPVVDLTAPTMEGAAEYWYSMACGLYSYRNYASTTQLNGGAGGCTDGIVLVAPQKADGTLLGVLAATNVDLSTSGPLSGDYLAPVATEITLSGLSGDGDSAAFNSWHVLGQARVPAKVAGSGVPSAGRLQGTGAFAPFADARTLVYATTEKAGKNDKNYVVARDHETDLSIDLSALALPWVAEVVLDPALRQLTWTEEGTAEEGAVALAASFRRVGGTFGWSVTAGPREGTVVLPTLPDPWTDYNPTASDEVGYELYLVAGEKLIELTRSDSAESTRMIYNVSPFVLDTDFAYTFTRVSLP